MIKHSINNVLAHIKFIVAGHIFNPLWHDRRRRRRKRERLTLEMREKYLSKYVPFIRSLKPDEPAAEPKQTNEKQFSIWFQGEKNAPKIVKICFESQRRFSPLEVVVLDETTLFEWITLPDYIMEKWRKGKIIPAHFADICRVELLYRYGGIWMDATDLMVSPMPDWIMESDFFIYLAGENVNWSYSFVQNCFFRSKKGNPLIKMWRDAILEYWRNERRAVDYFFHQILFKVMVDNNPIARKYFEEMPKVVQDPTHTMWFRMKNLPFDRKEFENLSKEAPFQKTEYRTFAKKEPIQGSYADYILNEKL